MSGFRDESLNKDFEDGIFDTIILHLIKCCGEMRASCMKTGKNLRNDEDKITNRLVEKYLNKINSGFRFIPQSPENYDSNEDCYKGITDIRVVTKNWFSDDTDYYIIECKRIDGKPELNKKYVTLGIARFIAESPKYLSNNKRNIMFGYVVKTINVPENITEIEKIQVEHFKNITVSKFQLIKNHNTEYYLYSCKYQSNVFLIELNHLFYNFSEVMRN